MSGELIALSGLGHLRASYSPEAQRYRVASVAGNPGGTSDTKDWDSNAESLCYQVIVFKNLSR